MSTRKDPKSVPKKPNTPPTGSGKAGISPGVILDDITEDELSRLGSSLLGGEESASRDQLDLCTKDYLQTMRNKLKKIDLCTKDYLQTMRNKLKKIKANSPKYQQLDNYIKLIEEELCKDPSKFINNKEVRHKLIANHPSLQKMRKFNCFLHDRSLIRAANLVIKNSSLENSTNSTKDRNKTPTTHPWIDDLKVWQNMSNKDQDAYSCMNIMKLITPNKGKEIVGQSADSISLIDVIMGLLVAVPLVTLVLLPLTRR